MVYHLDAFTSLKKHPQKTHLYLVSNQKFKYLTKKEASSLGAMKVSKLGVISALNNTLRKENPSSTQKKALRKVVKSLDSQIPHRRMKIARYLSRKWNSMKGYECKTSQEMMEEIQSKLKIKKSHSQSRAQNDSISQFFEETFDQSIEEIKELPNPMPRELLFWEKKSGNLMHHGT